MDGRHRRKPARVSRRRLLRSGVAGASGLAVATALACGSRPASTGGSSASSGSNTPKRGGTLVRASNTRFDASLDPHPLQPVYTSFYNMFYQTLLRLNPRTVALEPELALKWEQPSDTQYVLHL